MMKKLSNFGVDTKTKTSWGRRSALTVDDLMNKGYTLDYVKNSFRDETTSHFAGTFTESTDDKHHVTAEVVLTNPQNEKMVVPVTAQTTFSELLGNALDLDESTLDPKEENLILKAAMKKALEMDSYRY